jgi:hypothetical protein
LRSGFIDWDAVISVKDMAIGRRRDATEFVIIASSKDDESSTTNAVSSSDAFRIRNETTPEISSRHGGDDSVITLLDQFCVIFPSAYHHGSGRPEEVNNNGNSSTPFVTLHPRLLQALSSDDELLIVLDSLCGNACGFAFLSDGSVDWVESLSEGTMPLYAAMTARLIKAAIAGVEETTCGAELADRSKLTNNLLLNCRDSTFVPPTLFELSSMFLGPCPEKAFAESPMETLALTPLSWMVHYAKNVDAVIEFAALGDGLDKLLNKQHFGGNGSNALNDGDQHPLLPSASSRKKKKAKKNRRKVSVLSVCSFVF